MSVEFSLPTFTYGIEILLSGMVFGSRSLGLTRMRGYLILNPRKRFSGNRKSKKRSQFLPIWNCMLLATPPLSQLLPCLHQFLHRPGAGKSVRVDNAATAVSTLVEVEHGAHAQVRKVARQLVQMLTAQNVLPPFNI